MEKSQSSSKALLEEYSELIKIVAKVEYSRLSQSSHLLEFSELINIGATAVYIILSSQPKTHHNNSYISTAIKWAIRNELRRRYRWYSLKYSSKKNEKADDKDLRCSVYETILSIDDLEQAEIPMQIEDDSLTPDQKAELFELKIAIQEAMKYLSSKESSVLDAKFFKNKKIKEIAIEMNLSSSRVSKIIQYALDKIKVRLIKKNII